MVQTHGKQLSEISSTVDGKSKTLLEVANAGLASDMNVSSS